MEQTRFIVHEEFTGKRKPEDVFAAVFISNAAVGLSMMSYRRCWTVRQGLCKDGSDSNVKLLLKCITSFNTTKNRYKSNLFQTDCE